MIHRTLFVLASLLFANVGYASPLYWNVFNIEGESSVGADIVTYTTLADMLSDANRTSVNTLGGFGANIVGAGSDGSTYWNVFNIEGESAVGADIVTYSSLGDMLTDSNRTSVNTIGGFGVNIVGAGSDGSTYWNVFNVEGESSVGADIVTYASLVDMLSDSNRTSVNTLGGFGTNIVGAGSDGSTYWNVFNIEGESAVGADIVTYSSLGDMLSDSNRTGVHTIGGFGANIVGSGASVSFTSVPAPAPLGLVAMALIWMGLYRRGQNPAAT